jgi:copper chaperone CopZ
VRVAVNKIEGVETTEVSLNRGLAVIRFGRDNRATLEQVRQAIRRNGFTPKAAEVRIAGAVAERAGELTLVVPGQDRPYRLRGHPESADVLARLRQVAPDQEVVVEGRVPEAGRDGDASWIIEVRAFVEAPGRI